MSFVISFLFKFSYRSFSVWLCSCRRCVSGGLLSEASVIHPLLSVSMFQFCITVRMLIMLSLTLHAFSQHCNRRGNNQRQRQLRRSCIVDQKRRGKKKQNIFLFVCFFPLAVYLRMCQLENTTLNPSTSFLLSLQFGSLCVREVIHSEAHSCYQTEQIEKVVEHTLNQRSPPADQSLVSVVVVVVEHGFSVESKSFGEKQRKNPIAPGLDLPRYILNNSLHTAKRDNR